MTATALLECMATGRATRSRCFGFLNKYGLLLSMGISVGFHVDCGSAGLRATYMPLSQTVRFTDYLLTIIARPLI